MTFYDRFDKKYKKGADDECWNWTASVSTPGYGQIINEGKNLGAHRVAYERAHGNIPAHLVVDHVCRNRKCVNPNHLRLLTRVENIMCGQGITAKKQGATHCSNGHEYTEENVYLYNGHRLCRQCRRDVDAKRQPRERKSTGSRGGPYNQS